MRLQQKAEVAYREGPDVNAKIRTIEQIISKAILRKTLRRNSTKKDTLDHGQGKDYNVE